MPLANPVKSTLIAGLVLASFGTTPPVLAQGNEISAAHRAVIEYWTPERRAAAIPRDLVVDQQGHGYLRLPDGRTVPYGKGPSVMAKPDGSGGGSTGGGGTKGGGKGGGGSDGGGGGGDVGSSAPTVTLLDPVQGDVIGSSHLFQASVDDPDGLKSVSFVITTPSGTTRSFGASDAGGGIWTLNISGFTTSDQWSWHVVAKDLAPKGGNTTTTSPVSFRVEGAVTNAAWSLGGAVQNAAGRIYFQMPDDNTLATWSGYVCSGTVATDGTLGRSVIVTAAHCVYDDVNGAFARRVMFIPDQAGTSGAGTDLNCGNDPYGCWAPSFGVVDDDWTSRVFPYNVTWDYAYYVVSDSGAHSGTAVPDDALDAAVGSLPIDFATPATGERTHALGYSYSDDPNFMYCAEGLSTNLQYGQNWWLGSCDLSGGSSGGPWVQPMDTDPASGSVGSGPIRSVNSWGYTTASGMAGPMLDHVSEDGGSAFFLFECAKTAGFADVAGAPDGAAGFVLDGTSACLGPASR